MSDVIDMRTRRKRAIAEDAASAHELLTQWRVNPLLRFARDMASIAQGQDA